MIRRPMLFAAGAAAGAVIISYYAGTAAALIGVILLTAVAALCRGYLMDVDKRRHIALIVLVFYCLGAAAFWHEARTLSKESRLLDGSSMQGEIINCTEKVDPSGDSSLQLTVKAEHGKVLVNCYEMSRDGDILEGCITDITGELQDPSVRCNPGCFDYSLYLRAIGITKTISCDTVSVHTLRPFAEAPLAYFRNRVCEVREGFLGRLEKETDWQTAAMVRAILFGDKGELGEETIETFQKNGTAHILAVSGLHIGIIYGFILRLWRWRRRWIFFIFNMSFFILYAAAAGFSPSVTRAVVMVLLHIIAGIRGWRYDLSNAAFAVGLGVMMQNPYMLFHTGFQMSFLAVLTLVLILPYIKRFYSGVLLASLAVQIGLGPFILYTFNYLSLLAILINVPVAALASLLVPAGLIALALGSIPGSYFACETVKMLCIALKRLNEAGLIDGISCVQMPSPPLWMMAAYYLCLLLFATEEGRLALIRATRRGRYVLRTMIIVVVFSAGFHAFASDGFMKCDMTFVDVGQGDCMHLRVDDSRHLFRKDDAYHVLIDGGGRESFDVGKKILRRYLLKNGVGKIDLAIVTHLHNDHYDGIRSLCRMGMVEKLCVYEGYKTDEDRILSECCLDREHLIYVAAGDVIMLGDASFSMLAPPALSDSAYARLDVSEEDENKKSLLIKISYHGVHAMMTGDIGEEGEKDAMDRQGAQNMECDILKVGHHGSKTSSCDVFLDAVDPEIAVIQVGENNRYGHPSPETLERLEMRSVSVYRNDLQGAIGLKISGEQVEEVMTMK